MKLSWKWVLAAFTIITIGLVLRILAARGDLWLDEISTLTLVGRMHNPFQVFLLAHDNNHFLNSFYLYLVGPDATPLIQHSFSIVLGIATIIAAGFTLAPAGRGAALLAMFLFAVSFPMVNYGSEARGYAGLILCTVLAIHYLDKELREGGQRWKLAVTFFFGLLFHLTMIETVFALGLYAYCNSLKHTHSVKLAITKTVRIFKPTCIVLLIIAIDMIVAVMTTHEIAFGSITPFDRHDFVFGYGGMLMAMIGMPGKHDSLIGIILAIIAAMACFFVRDPGNNRRGIYIVFIAVLPLMMFVGHMPNSAICRYYLPSGVALLLCLADLAVLQWRKGFASRIVVVLTMFAILVQTVQSLNLFLHYGRSHYSDLVKAMTVNGPTTYTGTSNDFLNVSEIQFYASQQSVSATYVPYADLCRSPPDWLTAENNPLSPLAPASIPWGPAECRRIYQRVGLFPAWGLSGLTVGLYQQIN